jgi:dihydrolipoamide dehydrogenase
MGAEVTVAEVVDRILPVEDEEVSAFAKRAFEKQGMKILTGATVGKLNKGANNVTATITSGGKSQDITVDA